MKMNKAHEKWHFAVSTYFDRRRQSIQKSSSTVNDLNPILSIAFYTKIRTATRIRLITKNIGYIMCSMQLVHMRKSFRKRFIPLKIF